MDTFVQFTGAVRIPKAPDDGFDEDTPVRFMDGQRAVSKGFVVKTEPQYVAGEHIRDVVKISHLIFLPLVDLYGDQIDEDKKELYMGVAADIDTSIIEVNGASSERARAWLEASCPGLIEEIDVRLMQDEEGSLSDPVVSLRGLKLNEYADMEDDFTRHCTEIYLTDTLALDTQLPYDVMLNGCAIPLAEDDEQVYTVNDSRSLAFLLRAKIVVDPFEEGEVWVPAIHAELLGPSCEGETPAFLLPVDTFIGAVSMRRSYYGDR